MLYKLFCCSYSHTSNYYLTEGLSHTNNYYRTEGLSHTNNYYRTEGLLGLRRTEDLLAQYAFVSVNYLGIRDW